MSRKPASQSAKHKPCICRMFPTAEWLWRPTGVVNADRQAEFKCRLCGATSWKHSEAPRPAGEMGRQ